MRTLAPNIVTLLAMCAGLTAIRLAFEDRYVLALAAVVFAAILDGIDGRLARFLGIARIEIGRLDRGYGIRHLRRPAPSPFQRHG